MEIERKFLINISDINFNIESFPKKRYEQAYISTDPVIRIRNEGGEYVLCVKGSGFIAREEFELIISKEQFTNLWKKTEPGFIRKTRYFVPVNSGYTAEIDIYEGSLDGLVTAEVEFSSIEEAQKFQPPDYFGKDVTNDARYFNARLASDGLPCCYTPVK